MRRFASYSVASILVLLVAIFIAPASWLGLPVGARTVVEHGMAPQTVDRSRKSDRLVLPVTVIGKQQQAPAMPDKILDGCDPVFSPLSSGAKANLPGRCIS